MISDHENRIRAKKTGSWSTARVASVLTSLSPPSAWRCLLSTFSEYCIFCSKTIKINLSLCFLLLLSRLLEKSFELKTQAYEKQIASLREEIKTLKDERTQLHHQLEEGRVTSDSLKGEVARLTQQAKVGRAGF